MSTGARALVRSFGATAMFALLFTGLFGYGALKEAVRCCPHLPLARVTGTVGLALVELNNGGRYSAWFEPVVKFHLRGNRGWFRFDLNWPHAAALRREARRGRRVEIAYANCRTPFGGVPRCDAFEIVSDKGQRLSAAGKVIAERKRLFRKWAWLTAFAAAAATLFASLWGYCFVRASDTAPAP